MAMSVAAVAADIEVAPTYYDWTGTYGGLNAGGAWNNSNFNASATGPLAGTLLEDALDDDDAVFTGGAMIGYNWQEDSFVFGAEADFNYINFDKSSERDGTIGGLPASIDSEAGVNWFGTVRGRLGYAADRAMFYGTGGLAYGSVTADTRINVGGDQWTGDERNVNWGWTLGAGLDYAVDDNFIIGAEYLYVDLGSNDDWDIDANAGNGLVSDVSGNLDTAFSVFRVTGKWKF